MKNLRNINEWKHDYCPDKGACLYTDATPEQCSVTMVAHYCTNGQFGKADQYTTYDADKNLQGENSAQHL